MRAHIQRNNEREKHFIFIDMIEWCFVFVVDFLAVWQTISQTHSRFSSSSCSQWIEPQNKRIYISFCSFCVERKINKWLRFRNSTRHTRLVCEKNRHTHTRTHHTNQPMSHRNDSAIDQIHSPHRRTESGPFLLAECAVSLASETHTTCHRMRVRTLIDKQIPNNQTA